jgi:hypothetical protein
MIDIMKQIQQSDSREEREIKIRLREAEIIRLEIKIKIQEILARTPKSQIYFGKVKTE